MLHHLHKSPSRPKPTHIPHKTKSSRKKTIITESRRQKKSLINNIDYEPSPHHHLLRVRKPITPSVSAQNKCRVVVTAVQHPNKDNNDQNANFKNTDAFQFISQQYEKYAPNHNVQIAISQFNDPEQIISSLNTHTNTNHFSSKNVSFSFFSPQHAITHACDYISQNPFTDDIFIAGGIDSLIVLQSLQTAKNYQKDIICEVLSHSETPRATRDSLSLAGIDLRHIDMIYTTFNDDDTLASPHLQPLHTMIQTAYHANRPHADPCGAVGNMIDLKNLPNQLFSRPIVSLLKNPEGLSKDAHLTPHIAAILSLQRNTVIPSSEPPELPQNNEQQWVNVVYSQNHDSDLQYTWQDVAIRQRRWLLANQPRYNSNAKENVDYYYNEKKLYTMTMKSHLEKGYCCENICKHCPYGFPAEMSGYDLPKSRKEDEKGRLFPVPELRPDMDIVMSNDVHGSSSIIFARITPAI